MAHKPLTLLARQSFITDALEASSKTKHEMVEACTGDIMKAVDLILRALTEGKKILLCGNGGSAADAQHIAAEFVVRMSHDINRPALPAIALTTDTSILTAGSNDLGFENVFARQVEALGREGDILVGITTSGNSPNILRAFEIGNKRGLVTIGLLGAGGGRAASACQLAVIVPSHDTQRIQEGHITIGHILCALVEQEMYG